MNDSFDFLLREVMKDGRTEHIPILYITQLIIILQDLGYIREVKCDD